MEGERLYLMYIYNLRVLPVSEARERDVEGDGG
jgi:hypothetical protein